MTDHQHCPGGCDHPQPFVVARPTLLALAIGFRPGVWYCGQCWVQRKRVKRMYNCSCYLPGRDIVDGAIESQKNPPIRE